MSKIIGGCAGWDYKGWIGPFYPKNLKREHYLSHYSKIFNFNEINATFYNLPKEKAVRDWVKKVPNDFLFSIKVWQNITHKIKDLDIESLIEIFFTRMKILESKIFGYLFQFPPRFKCKEKNLRFLEKIISSLPSQSKYFLEFRDNSWFNPKILESFVDSPRINIVTSYIDGIDPHYYPEQSLYYIRLIGNHELEFFDRIQREQDQALNDLDQNVKSLVESPKVKKLIVIFNNNFRGFAPEDANDFKKRFGLSFHRFPIQQNLFDFI